MINRNALVLAVCLVGAGYCGAVDVVSPSLTTGFSTADPYYCPPGAKFCPAPGADNTVYLDTHFGMDARTGEVTAYTGNAHPDDVLNPPMTGERVLWVAPPISVENRYVPYPGAPQTDAVFAPAAAAARPAPVYSSQDMNRIARNQSPARRAAHLVAESEVADKQADRSAQPAGNSEKPWWKGGLWSKEGDSGPNLTEGERIPWWKGGMWRNRNNSDDDVAYTPPPRQAPPPSERNAPPDDIWDNQGADGYGDDPFANTNAYAGGRQPYSPDPFSFDQTSTPQNQYYDPYAAQQANAPVYAGEPYTLPDSPGPTSPYQSGYVYPGTGLAAGAYQQPAQAVQSYPVQQPMTASAGFLPPPPGGAGMAAAPFAAGAGGSSRLESAKRMVKEDRFTEAKNLLIEETRAQPRNAEAWRWLADCHYNLLELDAAINTYQRALDNDPNDYYALRGQGFSYLHRGHEYWRRMQEEVSRGGKEQAAATFAQAHENYKKALELLGLCLRRAPNDGEAIYGEAMAAEGASRKLYSNAVSYIKLGPEQRERAEVFAENCLVVINKGIERSREKATLSPGDVGPRALMGGLFLRKAILYNQLGKNDLALLELRNSRDVQQSILDEIDKNNTIAQRNISEIESLWNAWGGNRN